MPTPQSCDLIARAQFPLTDDDMQRLRRLVAQAASTTTQHGFVGFYSDERRIGVTATVVHGEVLGWIMFTARDAASAQLVAEALHQTTEGLFPAVLDSLAQAGADVMNKARLN
jgi:hypothetical protein